MKKEDLYNIPEFSIDETLKAGLFFDELKSLVQFHKAHCKPYSDIVDAIFPDWERADSLGDLPYIAVRLFKEMSLLSIPEQAVHKILTSSGTTGQGVSKIFLDKDAALLQVKTLSRIMQHVLGPTRLPMLVIDHPNVIKDRKSFSARGAGILGMMNFGTDQIFALDENMNLNMEIIEPWLMKHAGRPKLIFGFTFMVWEYFFKQIKSENKDLDFDGSILIHSGGWKKLVQQSVSNLIFKESLAGLLNIKKVHNFYGMIEQIGTIFLECNQGYLHAPNAADVMIRNPDTLELQKIGEEGVIEVLSLLPRSYPGHIILTEDLGTLHGLDGCRCGWRGSFFTIKGRVPRAELRGCSDTHVQEN